MTSLDDNAQRRASDGTCERHTVDDVACVGNGRGEGPRQALVRLGSLHTVVLDVAVRIGVDDDARQGHIVWRDDLEVVGPAAQSIVVPERVDIVVNGVIRKIRDDPSGNLVTRIRPVSARRLC